MNVDVAIIGAGPAGLFAAYEFSKDSNLNVILIDKGADINKRFCPSLATHVRCKECTPCNMLFGLGGAGGLSDGKLNLRPDVGGNLEEFVTQEKARQLVSEVEKIFLHHGVTGKLYGENAAEIEKNAATHGVQFIPIPQRHIGSDKLPEVITSLRKNIEQKNIRFLLDTNIEKIEHNDQYILHINNNDTIHAEYVLAAPGRSGADWLSKEAQHLGIHTRFAPIDIGVRIEVPAVVMDAVIKQAWDPKFHIFTKTYDDFIRTFCTCPNGFVVMEDYGDYLCVNGHSMAAKKSSNTNFGFVTRIKLTEPVENTTAYGISIAKLTTTIGGKMPLVQRLEDLRNGRRSTKRRIEKSFVTPTLENATPGDISMALPHRIVTDVIEGLEKLNEVIPGVASDSTLLYAPEIKFYSMRFLVGKNLETNKENFFVAGDGAGLSRGIVASAATGMIAAQSIKQKAEQSG